MKNITLHIILLSMFLTGCAYHLREQLVPSGAVVHIEAQSNYLPDGWSGIMSANYPGALAIVNDEVIFDCPGEGSRPWMSKIEYQLRFHLKSIANLKVLDDGAFGKKVISITVQEKIYLFLTADAELFFEKYNKLKNAP